MNIENYLIPRLTMEYKFKITFAPLESYREITVEASNDAEAKEKASQEFLKDQYTYPLGKKDLDNKMFRATYEIKGGNEDSGLEKTNPERE